MQKSEDTTQQRGEGFPGRQQRAAETYIVVQIRVRMESFKK